jgi:hypothetical protein
MTPLRVEDITLLCEDQKDGRSDRLIRAALLELQRTMPFVVLVRPVGVSSKNDVQVRVKFARREGYRAFGVRDRDFLQRTLVDDYRSHAFDKEPDQIRPWPLSRYCIESYLLDDDVLGAVIPTVPASALRAVVDKAAEARRWLDVARGTVDDLAWRMRRGRRSITDSPSNRESALRAVREAAELLRQGVAAATAEEGLARQLDALSADMEGDGPLRHRVDGRELVGAVEKELAADYAGHLPPGGLLSNLDERAQRYPPAALLADLQDVMGALMPAWRSIDV